VFNEPLSVGFDKSSDPSSESLYKAVDEIIGEMHEDGTLSGMAEEWYGIDTTVEE
jgi:polar amino acid transport system substrate-binding protein